jgi:hypothetical protein
MRSRVAPRRREPESSYAEFRPKRARLGDNFPTISGEELFWRYFVEKAPVLATGVWGERVATSSVEQHRTLSKATGPVGRLSRPRRTSTS